MAGHVTQMIGSTGIICPGKAQWSGSVRNARRCQPRVSQLRCQAAWEAGSITREVLTRSERGKLDLENDDVFYREARMVEHVDDGFLAQVTDLYRQKIPDGAVVLDLMSSWVSHFPEEAQYGRVIGHGMNAKELARNRRLSDWFVRNLNEQPDGWDIDDKSVDAILICVGVQYLQQPEKVFAEIFRVLKPGGVCIVTFSNRQFYDKAIQAWRDNTGYGRQQLVKSYFSAVAGFTAAESLTNTAEAQPSSNFAVTMLQKLWNRSQNDPFHAVIAYRNFKRSDD